LEPLKFIEAQGLAKVLVAPYEKWRDCLSPFRLAAISQVNHETGDINDIHNMSTALKKENPQTVVLVDGVQGFCKEATNLSNVDMYSFSAHKCHGPAGVGGLVVRQHIRLTPLLYGGGQENKLRPGTENIAGICQTAQVTNILSRQQQKNHQHVTNINATLKTLATDLPDVTINTTPHASPYILNMSLLGLRGEVLVHLLSDKGIYVSMGAACRSRKNTKTTLEVMGFEPDVARAAIRFSFSHLNTIEEAVAAKKIIADAVTQLRHTLRH
ncbi:MAG: aminotransferase class V-fold PLP-dependent enzyme, partial [Defluviitaleaceae bacterium]|nr:aminotransferase class V-fold PLP-dependent enzyme [Defluviitaleaceae bacterium]